MILQNGKRIDGCSDTVPVGTLQPYLGLVPPKGYLVCQGQLVSKITYSKLYEVCGDTFGASTDTHFYLPDLRGKTLAGYDENDTAMNTIGKLLGQKTHIHTTGNHTLTVAEMPKHEHSVYADAWAGKLAVKMTQREQTSADGNTYDVADFGHDTSSQTGPLYATATGSSQAHNHGDTGSNTNYQPTITVNWIVKAVMLIPEYIIVEDTLNSNSSVDALSARQGKILNEKFADYATKSEMIQYLPLSGGALTGPLQIVGNKYNTEESYGIDMANSDIINLNSIYCCDVCDSYTEGIHFKRSDSKWDTLRAVNGTLYFNTGRAMETGQKGTEQIIATRADLEGTIVFDGPGSGNWLAQETAYSFDVSAYRFLLVHITSTGVNGPTSRWSGNAINQVIYIDLTTKPEKPICNVDGTYYYYGGTEMHPDMQFLFGITDDPGVFFSGVFVSEDKKKIFVGNAGYFVMGKSPVEVAYGSLYNGVSRIVGFK